MTAFQRVGSRRAFDTDVWETGVHLSELETWSCYFEVSHQIEG